MNSNLPTLPQSLLNLICEYGMARTDKVSPLEIQHRWELLIAGIKDYAASVSAKLPWDERIFALYKDALEVFDGPETPQAVRDVIEWYHGSLLASQPPQDERGQGLTGNQEAELWSAANELNFDTWRRVLRAELAASSAQPVALSTLTEICQHCKGSGIVDDGEITCFEDGTPFENGPVKCVKDCPACAASAPAQQAGQREPTKTALAIMHELLETTLSEIPSFDHGKEAQEAWADRRAKARNDAEAFLAVAEMGRNKEPGEAIAEICSTYELHWVGAEPVAEICRRTGAKVGDKLYLASATPQPVAAEGLTGDSLIRSAQALLNLDADGALIPHGIGGHARKIIQAFINQEAMK